MRVEFDTTVLWGAFHKPGGLCFSLLALAAQRAPVLDGFITDVIGAEFWWRATQQGVKGPGQRVARTYSEEELAPFLEAFEVLFEPAGMERASIGRSLGRYAGLVGLALGDFLHAVTGTDCVALLSSVTTSVPVTFETVDIADLHVIADALENDAEMICSSDRDLLHLDPIGPVRIARPVALAQELGLIGQSAPPAQVRPGG
jgi:predicted nucleic acid-binding protein